MPAYCSIARSNYFRVKDPAAFRAWVDSLSDIDLKEKDGAFTMIVMNVEGWPPIWDETTDEEIEFTKAIAPQLADGEVCVLQEIGAHGITNLFGSSVAVHAAGHVLRICIDDIFELAAERWGIAVNSDTDE